MTWLATPAAAMPSDTHEYTLDNGLSVVVRRDARAPVAVSQLWYHVGSSYEHQGITGVSHVLEHMMFKGTETLAPGEFSQIVSDNGGEHNAFTSRDYTTYYEQLAADRLEVAFRLEADRMRNLRLDPAEFDKERQVVIEERRLRVTDQPQSLLSERFNAQAYLASPYGLPVIGWRGDLDDMQLADLQQWYERWYGPSNATLVVVGDVEPSAVRDLAEKHFGDIPAGEVPAPRGETGVAEPGERRLTLHRTDVNTPYLLMGYNVPSLASAEDATEVHALAVLSMILDGGEGAVLSEELVRGRALAASASAGYSPVDRLDTLFMLSGVPAMDHDIDTLEAALLERIEGFRQEPVSAETLQRAKTQLLADHIYQLDSTFYQAMEIGRLEATGIGWEVLEGYEAAVEAVTAAQVQAVARKYLTADRLTVARLIPAAHRDRTRQEAE
ncbi:insulinase family protein [Ectothiorhodospiraceae bacterium WFHF3C12]|nr:insulinase family protein [Ectothiorhodospiraceae bacterium WFHF3C12]